MQPLLNSKNPEEGQRERRGDEAVEGWGRRGALPAISSPSTPLFAIIFSIPGEAERQRDQPSSAKRHSRKGNLSQN
jgi:hypothetical protein